MTLGSVQNVLNYYTVVLSLPRFYSELGFVGF